jgi:hypothetical protein
MKYIKKYEFSKKSEEANQVIDKLLSSDLDESKIRYYESPDEKIFEYEENNNSYAVTKIDDNMATEYLAFFIEDQMYDSRNISNKKIVKLFNKLEDLYTAYKDDIRNYNL